MQGLMMDMPLLISGLIQYAADNHGEAEVVAREIEGDIHRYTYAQAHPRIKRMALALQRLGMKQGDRVGTLAFNTHRHRSAANRARLLYIHYGVKGQHFPRRCFGRRRVGAGVVVIVVGRAGAGGHRVFSNRVLAQSKVLPSANLGFKRSYLGARRERKSDH